MRHHAKHIKSVINQASLGTVQKHKLITSFTDSVTVRQHHNHFGCRQL